MNKVVGISYQPRAGALIYVTLNLQPLHGRRSKLKVNSNYFKDKFLKKHSATHGIHELYLFHTKIMNFYVLQARDKPGFGHNLCFTS